MKFAVIVVKNKGETTFVIFDAKRYVLAMDYKYVYLKREEIKISPIYTCKLTIIIYSHT